ncbi:MAG: Na-K-Cl cotransporter [Prochlorothrix sp.]
MTQSAPRPGLNAFEGVYTPSILTILGVIMYLRFGWVVGNVGLLGSLAIVTLATSITFLTALSIAEIATDRVIRVGGAYYMISRSLGIETGGAVGVPLYFAQALSVSLYTIGFAESLVSTFPQLNLKGVAIISTVLVAFLALTSAKLAVRSQYFIMAAIVLSLISFSLGQPLVDLPLGFQAPEQPAENFWQVFAVFFPAVTGIMAGVGLSGDLAEPSKAIPKGTLAAVATGYVIYMMLPLLLASRGDQAMLIGNPLLMQQSALWGPAILAGIWGATLSSAIGSILGAPRVLQALAHDGVLPRWLRWVGRGSGPDQEPRLATVLTMGVSLLAIILGDLNQIAPVLSMFFLTTYFVLNVSAGIERFLQSPSFRPTFQVPWFLSLLGAVGCLITMFLINPVATLVAAVIVVGVYLLLERQQLQGTWGDVREGIWRELAQFAILQLVNQPPDPKNWRPSILVLSGAPTKRWHLIELAQTLTHNRGVITVSSVLPEASYDTARQQALEGTIQEYLEKRGVQGLVRLVRSADPFRGAVQLVETYGFGPLAPNTVILGDSEEPGHREQFCQMIEAFHQAKRSVVVWRDRQGCGFGRKRYVDVWWGGLQSNGGLMLILAYLLRSNLEWSGAEVRLKLVAPTETAAQATLANLQDLVNQLRIGASPEVLVAQGRPFRDILHESSQDADLVLLGMATPGDRFRDYYENLQSLATGLPTTLFVLAAADMAFEEVLMETGG